MNQNYVNGRNSEWCIRNTLVGLGYVVTHNVAIQVKARKLCPSPSEYASAVNADLLPSTLKLVLYFPDGGAAGRILYSSVTPIPAWCAQVRWLKWMPPQQLKLRGLN